MPSEVALLESRTLRADHLGRIDVLEKVKALRVLPDGVHLSTDAVALYFAVPTEAVNSVVRRYRDELHDNGMRTLKGAELQVFEMANLAISKDGEPASYPQGRAHLRLFTRRTVLNIAMLLRDSEVARCVRTYLLDTEQSPRTVIASDPRYDGLDRRVADLEGSMARVGPALQELGPVLNRMSVRLESMDRRMSSMDQRMTAMDHRMEEMDHRMERMDTRLERMDGRLEQVDRRLDATNRVVGAMSVRLTDLSGDVADLQRRLPPPPCPRRKRRR
ncbi:Chromosome partition protein Smc [Streptomyces hundungensis]|uniref:Chromosome partition protein Smc n=1 Tax=Streptomyces hundungensis TaxID=1077946 RepID=A0A387HG99_9ACTN|nr:Chromosome partition protein Smc [Streptomyces hundungensis]